MKHKQLGERNSHHLVPRVRIKDYYGTSFGLPKNRIKLWDLKHAAWHVLFKIKTINEIIRYLQCRNVPSGYQTMAWRIVFKDKTPKQAAALLLRVRRAVCKKYEHLEFDPYLKGKLNFFYKKQGLLSGQLYLLKRFKAA